MSLASAPAAAVGVMGSLANFDAVNDTGRPAYGFEIEFEDSSFYKTSVGSVFGLNRNFGAWGTTGVVRFGTVDVSDYSDLSGNHLGVRITYGGHFDSGITTPSNPGGFSTPGESWWPGAKGATWTALPCDHFGVTTSKTPATTAYSWLVVDPNQPTPTSFGEYTRVLAGIPAVNVLYSPPQPAAPPQVQVQIRAIAPVHQPAPELEQPEVVDHWGEPYWVLTYKTKVAHAIDLGNLLQEHQDQEAAEVESEWSILQRRPLNKPVGDADPLGPGEVKEKVDPLDDSDVGKSVMRRYEFYRYIGDVNAEDGEVICDDACETDPLGLVTGKNQVGDFVGAQMAGYNIQAAVPEPQTWATMLAGMAGIGLLTARRRRV